MLTILYLHQYFNTPNMSGSTRSYEMARRFVAQGHEVHMITSWREHSKNNDWFVERIDGIHVHWLPVRYSNSMSFSKRIKPFFEFAFKSAWKAASIKADIIFATSTPLTIALPAIYASKKQRVPMVFEVRDLWPELPISMGALNNPIKRYFAKNMELFAYKNSSAIIALSPGMKDGIIRKNYPKSNIAVIPNSCDIGMFEVEDSLGKRFRRDRKWLGNSPLILYAGAFGLINGVDYLVDLAVELSRIDSDIKILAVGSGMEYDKVIKKAKNLEVFNRNFYIEKELKKKDMAAALNASTIATSLFIDIPEMRINSANKFFDALASARPVMINYGGWMHDLINSKNCGLAMWQKPIDKVAQELEQKAHDPIWLESASNAAIDLAKDNFDRDILSEQLLSILKEVASGHPEKAERIAPGKYRP
jgi:glycosyltransferase involved in cell wall biosynthesis